MYIYIYIYLPRDVYMKKKKTKILQYKYTIYLNSSNVILPKILQRQYNLIIRSFQLQAKPHIIISSSQKPIFLYKLLK